MSAVATHARIGEAHVIEARALVADAVAVSAGFPVDPRLEKAQELLVAALAELVKFQHNIGGPR